MITIVSPSSLDNQKDNPHFNLHITIGSSADSWFSRNNSADGAYSVEGNETVEDVRADCNDAHRGW